MGGKAKFPASKYESYLDTHLRVARGLDYKRRRVVLGPPFPNFGSLSRPTFERSGIMGGKEKFPHPNMESYLDTHLRVAVVVLIASEDVWFLGRFFPTPGPVLGPRLNGVGLWVEKQSSPASKYGIIFRYPFEGCTRGLDCERRLVVLGLLFPNFWSRSRPTFE
jgi:hypothetical protein